MGDIWTIFEWKFNILLLHYKCHVQTVRFAFNHRHITKGGADYISLLLCFCFFFSFFIFFILLFYTSLQRQLREEEMWLTQQLAHTVINENTKNWAKWTVAVQGTSWAFRNDTGHLFLSMRFQWKIYSVSAIVSWNKCLTVHHIIRRKVFKIQSNRFHLFSHVNVIFITQ